MKAAMENWAGPDGDSRTDYSALEHWEERGYKEAWTSFLEHCDQKLKGKAPLYVPYRLTVKSHRGMERLLRERHGSYSSYSSYLNLYAPWVELPEATGLPKGRRSPGDDASDTKRGRTSQRRV